MKQLKLNIWLNTIYLTRNFLIVSVLGILGLFLIGVISAVNSNNTVSPGMFVPMHGVVSVAAFLIALTIAAVQFKDRNIKMIVTKPCLPEVWTAGTFASLNLISFGLHLIILILAAVLFMIKGSGLGGEFLSYLFIWCSSVVSVMIFSTVLLFLTFIIPPAFAVLVMLALNSGLLLSIVDACFGYTGNILMTILLKILGIVFYAVYLVAPYFSMDSMMQAMQNAAPDWAHLALFAIYGAVTAGFYYLLAVFVMKRKNLI